MAKTITSHAGFEALTDISTTLKHPLGTVVQWIDSESASGPGEAIYLLGVADTVAGDFVTFDGLFATARLAAGAKGPIACALAANVASSYGWYVLTGNTAATLVAATAASAALYECATAATADDAVVAGDVISGATTKTSAIANLNRSAAVDIDAA